MSKVRAYLDMVMGMAALAGDVYFPDKQSKKQQRGTRINPRTDPKIGRNEPCPCGSGKKYKKCCLLANER